MGGNWTGRGWAYPALRQVQVCVSQPDRTGICVLWETQLIIMICITASSTCCGCSVAGLYYVFSTLTSVPALQRVGTWPCCCHEPRVQGPKWSMTRVMLKCHVPRWFLPLSISVGSGKLYKACPVPPALLLAWKDISSSKGRVISVPCFHAVTQLKPQFACLSKFSL